jgi:hypothetical protein
MINTKDIWAGDLQLLGIAGQATFNGTLETNGALGMSFAGHELHFNGNIQTTGGGGFILNNISDAVFLTDAHINLDGPFLQNGSGYTYMGGFLKTQSQNVQFTNDLFLNNNLQIDTDVGPGDLILQQDIDGAFNLTIRLDTGSLSVSSIIGDEIPLKQLIVETAYDIHIEEIGSFTSGITELLNLTASHDINLTGSFFSAEGAQYYSAGHQINFKGNSEAHILSFGGSVNFASGPIKLDTDTDLIIQSAGGDVSFVDISGTSFENVKIYAGSGIVTMDRITGPNINNVIVEAGSIQLTDTIEAFNLDMTSQLEIANLTIPFAINSVNTASFNALSGNVGTLSNAILVNTTNQIFAGAGGSPDSFANFNGTSADNTVNPIPTNPPCFIFFNGVIVKSCTPPPPPPPTPSQPAKAKRRTLPFAVPGFDSSYFNLASNYFFLPDFFDDRYVKKEVLIYYTTVK